MITSKANILFIYNNVIFINAQGQKDPGLQSFGGNQGIFLLLLFKICSLLQQFWFIYLLSIQLNCIFFILPTYAVISMY